MAKKQARKGNPRVPKTVLRLPDLDLAKSAVLNSLSSTDAQRRYRHAIEEFVLGHVSIQTTERYLGYKQRIRSAGNDRSGIEPEGGVAGTTSG